MRLSVAEWQGRRLAHQERVRPWTADRIFRSQRGIKHPVHDFLFEYYSFRAAHLTRWSPGLHVVCDGSSPGDWEHVSSHGESWSVDPAKFPLKWRPHLEWGTRFLEVTVEREPSFGCFGLHEWAMVFRPDAIRHSQFSLRLSQDDTNAVVESLPIRCTHIDAYRFFTAEATPKNRIELTRANQIEYDQPGCIHANMDLYKWAFRLGPFLPAELIGDSFELACLARDVDMRASPYDLRSLGYEPIRIETKDGREEYAREQRRIAELAMPLRKRLFDAYRLVSAAITA